MIFDRKMSCLASLIVLYAMIGCSPTANPIGTSPVEGSPNSQTSLPLQATIDLGVIVQGRRAELSRWIKNSSNGPVHVSRTESSCDCLEVRLSHATIAPGERTLAHARYDGAREPEFVGSLQIEVQLIDDKGTEVGRIDIPVEVIRESRQGRTLLTAPRTHPYVQIYSNGSYRG